MKNPAKKPERRPHTVRKLGKFFEKRGNAVVFVTIASVIVSTILGIALLSPLLYAAAVFPFFYIAMTRNDHRWGLSLVLRWAITVFITILVLGVFVPGRLTSSIPTAQSSVSAIQDWVNVPGSGPPADLPYMLWGMALFLVGSLVSGGLLGFLVGAAAVAGAASGAVFLFRHGFNIFQISLVAVPLWQLSLFISAGFLLVPASHIVFERFLNVERDPSARPLLRTCMYMGALFFVLSLAFRYAAAGPWRSALEHWTTL